MSESNGDRIMLFDLSVDGHHPGYILHLIQYWNEQKLSGYLDIVVTSEFLKRHNNVVKMAKQNYYGQIQFVAISQKEENYLPSPKNFFSRKKLNFLKWQLFCRYARLLKSKQALLMYFDTYQLPILLGITPPCATSGIYFRPKFHYDDFDENDSSWKESWHRKREKLHLFLVLRNKKLKTIFCLDPFVLKHLKRLKIKSNVLHLVDPVRTYQNYPSDSHKIRSDIGVDANQKVFLLFGALSKRKGLFKLLDALFLLSSEVSKKTAILLVGTISPVDKIKVQYEIEQLKEKSKVKIFLYDNFVCDQDILPYFQASDFILAPYQNHVGMSAILVRAATAEKPVLSSNYGLMGEITRRNQLGLTVNTKVSSEIAKGIEKLVGNSPSKICNYKKMKNFSKHNNPEKFAETIFKDLLL